MNPLPQYFRRLRRVLLRRGNTHAQAEDLIQEAFLRMQEYCERGGEVLKPEGFLMRTVLRLASNARRDEHRELYCEIEVENLTLIVDTTPTPDEVLAGEECLERMRNALDAVSRRTRDVFFMQRLDGLSYAEIAERLGVSISAVEKHVASALAVLADVNLQE
jgi:RNA polymerase sigma-70 factor (ECF subfamily)